MPSFSLAPGLSSAQLRSLLREKKLEAGATISTAEAKVLEEIAAHPNADAFVKDDVRTTLLAHDFGNAPITNPSLNSILAARSVEGSLDLFGLPEAELGSIPDRYDAGRLAELFIKQRNELRDGKKISQSELSWCHLLAVHPNANQNVRTQVADFLEGRKVKDGLQPVVQRLLKGLRGQASLSKAPKPPSSNQKVEIPRAPKHVFMAPDLDAAELGFFLDRKLKELLPHDLASTPELAASLLEMATHQNADVFFRRKVGQRLIEHKGFKVLDERLRQGAKTLLAGGTITLGAPLSGDSATTHTGQENHHLPTNANGLLLMPVGLRAPKLRLPDEDTSAKDLIEFVAKHMDDCKERWGESFNIQAGFLSWAISVSQMPNANDDVRKALGKALLSRPREQKWKPVIDVFAKVLAKGDNLAPHGFTLHFGPPGPLEGVKPEMEISADGLQRTLENVEKLLVEAAGSDALLESHEVDSVLKVLGPVQRQSVQRLYQALVDRTGNQAIQTAEFTTLFKEATSSLNKAQLTGITKSTAAKLSIFAGLCFDFARVVQMHNAPNEQALRKLLVDSALSRSVLDYDGARDALYSVVDNHEGKLTDVYTGRVVTVSTRGEASEAGVNTEHTRPKSKDVEHTPAESDLLHLFVTDAVANGKRSSWPFGIVQSATWKDGESKLGENARGDMVFEPPKAHRGNIARALFYVSIAYGLSIDKDEEAVLRQWHIDDPVDAAEERRNSAVEDVQKNRNPFIDDSSLVSRITGF